MNGFASSSNTIFWTLIILFVVLYCASVISVKMIGHNPDFSEEHHDVLMVDLYFGNVQRACFTFFQFLTTDGW